MNLPLRFSYPIVIGITLLAIVLGLFNRDFLLEIELWVFIFLMIITGIPHGATDHLVFKIQQKEEKPKMWPFFLSYLMAMGIYGLMWIAFPLLSLTFFILISAFHFGQSQMLYIKLKESDPLKWVIYLIWGSTILSTFLLFHQEESLAILGSLVGQSNIASSMVAWETYYLALLSSLLIIILFLGFKGFMKWSNVILELFHLLLLITLSLNTSLLISFSIYFGLWHSLSSIHTEVEIIKQKLPSFNLFEFFRQAVPYTVISFVGIGILLLANYYLSEKLSPFMIFFIAISTVTLPHMYYMQGLYQQFSPFTSKEKNNPINSFID